MQNHVRFFFELGHLKRVLRSGWTLLGIRYPESVAEHSLRAAQIAYFLAIAEGRPDPHRACTMVVFHDMGETRTGDPHKVIQRYVTTDERRAVKDQCASLGIQGELLHALWDEREADITPDAQIANDADALDAAIQAKEYMDQGFPEALEWIEYAQSKVKTETAKTLLSELREIKLTDWWKGLKKL